MKAADQRKLIAEMIAADRENVGSRLGKYARTLPKDKRPDMEYGVDF